MKHLAVVLALALVLASGCAMNPNTALIKTTHTDGTVDKMRLISLPVVISLSGRVSLKDTMGSIRAALDMYTGEQTAEVGHSTNADSVQRLHTP